MPEGLDSGAPRAPWWRAALATIGIVGLVAGSNEILSQPTEDQKKAEAALSDPNTIKKNYRVSSDPEVEQYGGLAVRNEPRPDIKGEPPGAIGRLAAGVEIKDAIPWIGKSPDNPDRKDQSWVAFKDSDGKIKFAALKYLEISK